MAESGSIKLRRTTITFPGAAVGGASNVDKGHFVVYTADGLRFVIQLHCLKNGVFQELLKIAEEEYGSQSGGPNRLPFESSFLHYTMSVMGKCMRKDHKEAILTSVTSTRCISTLNLELAQIHSQLPDC